jgi:hypothetical protein
VSESESESELGVALFGVAALGSLVILYFKWPQIHDWLHARWPTIFSPQQPVIVRGGPSLPTAWGSDSDRRFAYGPRALDETQIHGPTYASEIYGR